MPEELTLLPCPACGAHPELGGSQDGSELWIACGNLRKCRMGGPTRKTVAEAVAAWNTLPRQPIPKPLDEWNYDDGDVLWWRFPLEGPPYVGSPLDEDWVDDGYFTHWTPLPTPQSPE